MADILTRITLAVFHSIVTLPKGVKVRAADVEIGREGVTFVATTASNRYTKEEEALQVRACIVAAVRVLYANTPGKCEEGAAAGRQWVRNGKPHFTLTQESFDKAFPGKSHIRSRWNSARLSLANVSDVPMMQVGILKGEGEVHFIPVG